MSDERPTHGGAANMPPFPRASTPDTARQETSRPSGESPAPDSPNRGDTGPTSATGPAADAFDPATGGHGANPPIDGEAFPGRTTEELAGSGPDATEPDHRDPPVDEESSAGEPLDDEYAPGDDDWDESDEDVPFRTVVTAELARRAELSLLKGMEHVAETFEETAHRINRLARLRGGPEAASIRPVHATVGWLEGAADYLRSSDLEEVQSDLRHHVRARPVQSLGIALCAGWVLGRILR